jgi:D-alanine-D-alanine ligase
MRLCVLLGGPSAEREVSLLSGSAMARALEAKGHDVVLLDPATGREMRLADFHVTPPQATPPSPEDLGELSAGSMILESLQSDAVRSADVVVLGLHGVPGEDGVMQSVLELLGKRYTGSNSRTSALCIDKNYTKIVLKEAGIPVPNGLIVKKSANVQEQRTAWDYARVELRLPMVIKPNDQGSTVGLTILRDDEPSAFFRAIELACMYSDSALVEEFVEGRELTVTVLGREALPIVEIAPEGGFYDYHHKYTKGMTVYTCPAALDDRVTSAIQADALKAFEACGCRGYARIDFRLRDDGTFACLEINTLPGMTSTSLVPKAAAAAGMTFEDLCEQIVQSAFPDAIAG